ncbi:MAG: hypothetical protein IKL65_01095, partial [Bacilli bacterium]|nr:hypothetical protein [Bacilli bacterium]
IEDAREESNERSVDMFGRSIQNAVARYQLNNNESISGRFHQTKEDKKILVGEKELTIEYDGNEVVCTLIEIYKDGNIYLGGCRINGVGNINYGTREKKVCSIEQQNESKYSMGDVVTCELSKGTEKFYVLEDTELTSSTINLFPEKNITTTGDAVQSDDAGTMIFANNDIPIACDASTWEDKTNYWIDLESSNASSCNYTVKEKYINNNYFVYDENSNLYPRVNAYKEYLIANGISNVSASLLSSQQLSTFCDEGPFGCESKGAPLWIYSTGYYLGTTYSRMFDPMYEQSVYHMFEQDGYYMDYASIVNGIRPYITIATSNL